MFFDLYYVYLSSSNNDVDYVNNFINVYFLSIYVLIEINILCNFLFVNNLLEGLNIERYN